MADEEGVEIPIVYVGVEDEPILLANQFVIQHQQNEFILTIGQIAPPILLGTEQERMEQAKQVAYVPVNVVGRFTFTRERLVELLQVLQTNLDRYDMGRKA
jgi:hypothetical protein